MRELVVLTGPTAVGKTELSLELAEKINGEIISADSMQIYKDMDIGTAKASASERKRVEHHLINIAEADEDYSVSRFQKDADKAIKKIENKGKIPLLVGGTHLYIKAVLEGFMLPEIEPDYELRQELQNLAEEEGTEAVHAILAKKDPKTAEKLHPNDIRRVIRAIEIYEQTAKTKSQFKKEQENRPPRYKAFKFALIRSRENLYQRINQRVDIMLDNNLLEEVKFLLSNYNLSDTAQQALGYKEIISYLNDKITLEEAVKQIKKRSRHFAKRQLTWLRKEADLIVFDIEKEDKKAVLEEMTAIIKGEEDYERQYKKRKQIDY